MAQDKKCAFCKHTILKDKHIICTNQKQSKGIVASNYSCKSFNDGKR